MPTPDTLPEFLGQGTSAELAPARAFAPWHPDEYRAAVDDETQPDHPAGYTAGEDLVNAVNTALLLNKPLLLTGNPGTGKSDVAQRIAWEFGITPVLRFEAQSLSEANDLFYRFDLVRHVARSHMTAPAPSGSIQAVDPRDFLSFGPLGKAILRSNPTAIEHQGLWERAFPKLPRPDNGLRSVVLIDEIDKASRDFPNDLLNAIERLEVPIRDVPNARLAVNQDKQYRPIIVITSNSERELPAPFLRRCVFCHIKDPGPDLLRKIVRARVFPETLGQMPPANGQDGEKLLPALLEDMLKLFVDHRDGQATSLNYACGPAELIDWSKAVRSELDLKIDGKTASSPKEQFAVLKRSLGSLAKHRDDYPKLLESLVSRFGHA